MIKSLIKKVLYKRGLVIKPYEEYEEQLEKVKDDWLINQDIKTIIDIGASYGGYAKKIRKLFPNAKITSFEPIPASYKSLTSFFETDPNFKAFNVALGDRTGTMEFFENDYVGSSSLLEMADLHKEAYPQTKNYSKINVDVDTLDNMIEPSDLDSMVLVKIDVQGYEENVLRGAEQLLPHVDIIFTEVSFNPLYKGQLLINGIIDLLKENGFAIAGVENVSQSLKDGTFLQADLYFTRSNVKA